MLPPFIKDKIIPRIKHFRKVAKDKGAFPAEKEVAEQMYKSLMAKHKITEDMLEGDEKAEETFFLESPYQYILLMTTAEHYGLKVFSNDDFTIGRITGDKRIVEAIKATYEKSWDKIDSYIVGMMIYYSHKILPKELLHIKQSAEWNPYDGDERNTELKLLPEPNPFIQYDNTEEIPEELELEDFEEEEETTVDDIIDKHAPEQEGPKPESPMLKHKTLKKLYVQDENVLDMVRKMKKSEEPNYSNLFGGLFG